MPRTPLRPLAPDERARKLAELGLGDDLLPSNLSPAERHAATEEKPMPETLAVPSFVPPQLRAIAAIVAGVSGLVLVTLPKIAEVFPLPAWAAFAVFAVTAIACFLAGLALPSSFAGKPIVPLTMVPLLASGGAIIGKIAAGMPEGAAKNAVLLVVALLLGAAGAVTPAPGQTVQK